MNELGVGSVRVAGVSWRKNNKNVEARAYANAERRTIDVNLKLKSSFARSLELPSFHPSQ